MIAYDENGNPIDVSYGGVPATTATTPSSTPVTSPALTGAGGMPVGGANPILATGTPAAYNPLTAYGPPLPQAQGTQFTPKPFMPAGMTFQPHTQFGQQASAPLNISQRGQVYGHVPLPPLKGYGYAVGGMLNSAPQFQNPFGPQQTPVGPRMYGPGSTQQPVFDQRMQPQNMPMGGMPQQPGLPGLLPPTGQNSYQGYTPIGPQHMSNYG
jgi:hypothetical protein